MQAKAWVVAAVPLIGLLAQSPIDAAKLTFDPHLARNPPQVERATVELLRRPSSKANAKLRVQFEKTTRRRSIVIRNGEATTLLRDDGISPDEKAFDRVYTALINLNVDQYAREQRRRLRLAEQVKEVPIFKLRRQIGTREFRPSPLVWMKPGIPTVIDDFEGVPSPVDPARELVITDLSVVEDPERTYDACTGTGTPMGAWTFGHLMTEIANESETGIDSNEFVEHWFGQWLQDLTINGFGVTDAAAGAQPMLDQWPRLPGGELDLAQAPFRLLAIVNRIDLRESTVYGSNGSAGEARLVFGFLNCEQTPILGLEAMEGTVIFEYGVDKQSCFGVRNWAQQWTALGDLPLGSPQYNAALQAITDQVTASGAQPSQLPNRSAINQVRTNEKAFVHDSWQFRESKLCSSPTACAGYLENTTVAQTPDRSFIFTETLEDFISSNETAILNGSHFVPLFFPLFSHFRAGFIHEDNIWDVSGPVNPEALSLFGRATCNGCHKLAPNFLHIANRNVGTTAALSDFLTEDETLHRQMILDATANMICAGPSDFALEELFIKPLPSAFVH